MTRWRSDGTEGSAFLAISRPAAILCLSGIVLLSGCAPAPQVLSLAPPTTVLTARDYPRVRSHWTRDVEVIRHLISTLRVYATFRTPEFNAAYVAYVAHTYRYAPSERAALAETLAAEWARGFHFVVAAATHDMADNDLDRKDSIWHISLTNDTGQHVLPASIERVRRVTVSVRDLYPYVDNFDQVYHLEFPRQLGDGTELVTAETKRLTLTIAGPQGVAKLVWTLLADGASSPNAS